MAITQNKPESDKLANSRRIRRALAAMQADIDAYPTADAAERAAINYRTLVRLKQLVIALVDK